jgi:ABC-type nitrate/sulfonate/bicarbonate transport system substrate-binding protein
MGLTLTRRRWLTVGAGALALGGLDPSHALAQAPTRIKIMTFPISSNLSIFAAQHKGYFAKHGLVVEHLFTPNSDVLRDGLARGDHQIAHAAVDNAVAMAELAMVDIAIITGGDNGFNRIYVQPGINSYADLRGKTVVVDAPDTAFALLLYKVLKDNGLNKGDYVIKPVGGGPARLDAMLADKSNAAAMLGPPFTFRAEAAGLKDMGPTVRAIGAYQSDGAFVMRDWARQNGDVIVSYIRALIEGRRWVLDPANKAEATQLLIDRLQIPPAVAAATFAVVSDPVDGIAKDLKFDMDGFRNVLKLRAEIEGQWGGNPPPPEKYLDLSLYDRALGGL